MRRVKVAQIGINCLSHGKQICGSIKKQNDIFELVGYALPENEREKFPLAAAELEDYPELTVEQIMNDPEIEAVIIETEELYLTKYALLAAEHKKHIHMEKPGGVSLADFEKLISAVKKNKTVFHTGYMYRYNPYVRELIQSVQSGELGEIVSIDAEMNCYHKPENRQWLSCFDGGMMFFLGCHLIDLILQLQGKPDRVTSFNRCTGADNVTASDFGMAVLEYGNTISTVKTSATEIGGFPRRHLVVTGTKKTVELCPLEVVTDNGVFTQRTEYAEKCNWHDVGQSTKSKIFDRYDTMMADFAQLVRGEKENPYTYDYELELYRVLTACCGK